MVEGKAIEAIVTELQSTWATLDRNGPRVYLTDADLARWSADCGVSRSDFCDQLAIRLAKGYHQNALEFWFCDWIVNDISGFVTSRLDELPNLFWSVFLAFDAGEWHRAEDQSDDPEATHTRPMIADIVKSYDDHS